MHLTKNSSC